MAFRYCMDASDPLRASFDVYLNDKHAATDRIQAMTGADARGALMMMREQAPHAVAKVLAIFWPWCADVADDCERVIQESLPLSE